MDKQMGGPQSWPTPLKLGNRKKEKLYIFTFYHSVSNVLKYINYYPYVLCLKM
jgi:hypothetical protein